MEEKELILKMYRNIEMGIVGINSIDDKVESRSLLKTIIEQRDEYSKYKTKLVKLCAQYQVEDKELSALTKLNTDIMVAMKHTMKPDDKTLAKMMVEGTNKGIMELESLFNQYRNNNDEVKDIMEDILKFEKDNIEELKIYL